VRGSKRHSFRPRLQSLEPVTPELLEWADLIFVMERAHRNKLAKKFRAHLKEQQVICLNIPDEYAYMDPRLVQLFEKTRPATPWACSTTGASQDSSQG
jgi:predicted protein tyrosine phosphatase